MRVQPVADGPLVEQPANLAVPGLKAKILVDHQPHVVLAGGGDDRLRGCEVRRQRLLADDRAGPPGRGLHQAPGALPAA